MRKNDDVIYRKADVEQKGYLVTLYCYSRHNSEEQRIVMRFDPQKVDGHGVQMERVLSRYG